MRKVASTFMLVLLMWSCDKTDRISPKKVDQNVEQNSIRKAQMYFESEEALNVIGNPNANGSSALSLLGLNKAADWLHAKEFETNKEKIIEVPITFEKKQGHVASLDISKKELKMM